MCIYVVYIRGAYILGGLYMGLACLQGVRVVYMGYKAVKIWDIFLHLAPFQSVFSRELLFSEEK